MNTSVLYNINMARAKQSTAGRRIIRSAEALSEGIDSAESSAESNVLWERWNRGDKSALDLYIKSNIWLFVKISLMLKTRFTKMDLEHIYSIVVGYSQVAFSKYDSSRNSTVLSFHTNYCQYEVSHINEKMSALHGRQIALLRIAKQLSVDTGMDFREALIQVIVDRKACIKSKVKQYADKIIAASSSKQSLDQPIDDERGSKLLYETIEAPQEDLYASLDRALNSRQLDRIKAYITKDLSERDKGIFQGMLNGMPDTRLAEDAGVGRNTINRARNRILKKTKCRANELKKQGISLPAIF